METISRDELKTKLDRGDDFKLIMTLGNWQFREKHIPGSIQIESQEQVLGVISPDDDVVVYCSDRDCIASQLAYNFLTRMGYKYVRRYSGGTADWEKAGYPLEGNSRAA